MGVGLVGSPMVVRFGTCVREMWRPPSRRNVVSFDLPAYVLTPFCLIDTAWLACFALLVGFWDGKPRLAELWLGEKEGAVDVRCQQPASLEAGGWAWGGDDDFLCVPNTGRAGG